MICEELAAGQRHGVRSVLNLPIFSPATGQVLQEALERVPPSFPWPRGPQAQEPLDP